MSKFLICECCNQTYLEEDMSKNNKNMCCSCWCYTRPKDKRIAELEEQLKNAIMPKFKIGQKVYKVYTPNQKYPFEFKIIGFKITKSKGEDNIFYNVEEDGFDMGWYPDEILFATKEEAQAKLEELKGENK